MNHSHSEDLEYDLVPDFDTEESDMNTHDVDPDQDPFASSAKIQTASELQAISGQEQRQAAIAESSECYINTFSLSRKQTRPFLSEI
jgi:hypothetical protein